MAYTPRTNAELASDFPIDTSANTVKSIAKFDLLVHNGVLGQKDEIEQLLEYFGAQVDTYAEDYEPTLAVVGTAGTASRSYALVPRYPLPTGLLFVAGVPAEGGSSGRQFLYGKPSKTPPAEATVPNTVDASDYVTVTLPALSADAPAGTKFDVLVSPDAGTTWYLLASAQAAGAVVDDKTADVTTLKKYTPYSHAEFGVDATTNPHTVVYGSKVTNREI